MKSFPISVVSFGAGSQPEEPDFSYLQMPRAEPLATPRPPDDANHADMAAAAAVIEQLLEGMDGYARGSTGAPCLSLRGMVPSARQVLNESLGEGEVSAVVQGRGRPTWRVQETAFAGVWRLQRDDGLGDVSEDLLESDGIPAVVTAAVAGLGHGSLDRAVLPPGVMNAPALLAELRHHAPRYRSGAPAHVLNLSLLPMAPADHEALDAALGQGPVSILSRGFGNCRIESTCVENAWRVRYFNSMNTVILDTIELVDLPEAARAGPEDREESAERLRELVAWLKSP